MAKTIGIDLGTTNTVAAFIDGTRVETLTNAEGSRLTPSVVFYKSGDEIIVGELAKRQHLITPERCIKSVKRIMGKRYADFGDEIDDLPYPVVELDDGMAAIELAPDVHIRPEEVSADILDKIRQTAEDYLNDTVDQAVITVPAHFNDQQRTATKIAAEMAGLEVLRIINEPTAAALAYGIGGDRGGIIVVFDFGGGTFDVSLLQISNDIFEVLSTNGDNSLGGDDVDQRLFQEICDGILQSTGIDPTQDRQAAQRIREAAEKAKCELSTLNSTSVSLPFIVADSKGPKHFERDFTRKQFNEMMESIFQRLFSPCERALKDANLTVAQINEVLLVGGSTRIPRVQEMVRQYFGKEPNRSVNPDEAVAAGAAIQSGVISGALREILLLDVTPLTLGIELAGGVFKPLIQRNSTIPCEASERFTTVVDNQTTVLVHVLQGERKQASQNHSLAKFRLTGIPPAPKELAEIMVHFSIDANGILAVSATEMATGIQTGVLVENYGEIGARESDVKKLVEAAKAFEKADEEFVRFSIHRQTAERLEDRANKYIVALADIISEEHVKQLKESMLKLDLAMDKMDEREMKAHEDKIEEILADYENNAELHRALRAQMSGQLGDQQAITSPGSSGKSARDMFHSELMHSQSEVPKPQGPNSPSKANIPSQPPPPQPAGLESEMEEDEEDSIDWGEDDPPTRPMSSIELEQMAAESRQDLPKIESPPSPPAPAPSEMKPPMPPKSPWKTGNTPWQLSKSVKPVWEEDEADEQFNPDELPPPPTT